jgi:hypothetical protein
VAHLVVAVTFFVMLWTGACLYSPALAEVMNRPSDGPERAVGNNLAVIIDPKYTGNMETLK